MKSFSNFLRLVVAILFAVSSANLNAQQLFDILSIAGKNQNEVSQVLGKPVSCEDIRQGKKCAYKRASTEVVFIKGVADWITIMGVGHLPFNESILESIGLPKFKPKFKNQHVMRWQNVYGLREVSLFPAQSKAGLLYIHARTLY